MSVSQVDMIAKDLFSRFVAIYALVLYYYLAFIEVTISMVMGFET